ncbi:hypothetical protein AMK21_30690 [Streptomyces sp. CB00316]|uniref:hypothetical protein n=1 Tax=Streptomyces sp. CB00316 TaxID=1703932 RepID=UPI00093C934D|nr:hypothetical protein [Streptomyces sp. CB00316]OKJ10632.1 hypothetical protein AMK21_30690 [Streptomyces sp. CB00316]
MNRETVVWTLLPDPSAAQVADGLAHLSLVFGLQLSSDETGTGLLPLSRFPLVHKWPQFPFKLSVRFRTPDGSSTSQATIEAVPDPTLWSKLFATTQVKPCVFDHSVATDPLQSYPLHLVADSLREEYGRLFADAEGHLADPSSDEQPGGHQDGWAAVDRLVRLVGGTDGHRAADAYTTLTQQGVVADDFGLDPYGWTRVADFHEPFAHPQADGEQADAEQAAGEAQAAGALQLPDTDFHGLLAALADHPGLMERLGLVRRVTVPLPASLNGAVSIQAVPLDHPFVRVDQPFTQCVVRQGRLVLGRRNGTAGALLLPLDDTAKYTVHDVDVDSAALAFQSYADMLAGLPRDGEVPELRAPALRSDGIFVAEADRQVTFRENLKQASALDTDLQTAQKPGDAITLHADNVQQGYRVDVFDVESGRWYPLCRRTGHYTVRGHTGPLPIDDEGTVADALHRGEDRQGRPVNRLHQSLIRWGGWSSVVELPGKMLNPGQQLQDPGPALNPSLPFSSVVEPADGTLPSLRYGRSYRFRARLVDLAGRSLPFKAQPTAGEPATPPLRYSRYEPVPAPVLVPRRPVTPGESLTVLVVRTDNANAVAPAPGPTCDRHLLAPKAAVQMLERHGVLDVTGQNRLNPAVHDLLSRLDGGAVQGQADPGAGGTPYVDSDRMALPWPPDPLCRGVVLHDLPGMPELLAAWPQGGGWHERLPLRLVLVPGGMSGTPPVPVVDLAARTIRVTLGPGANLTTLLSSMLSPGDEDLLGLWQWFTEFQDQPSDVLDETRARAATGQLAQLTPSAELRLIHAVRCPVTGPVLGRAKVERAPGETAYVLDDQAVTIHEPTTLSVHAEATWTEYVDDVTQNKPSQSRGRAILHQGEEGVRSDGEHRPAVVGESDGSATAVTATVPFRARHDVGDTRHRAVRFTPVGTSRFVSYFTQRRKVRLTGTGPVAVASSFVPGTVVVRAAVDPLTTARTPADPGPTYTFERDFTVDDVGGKVSRTSGSGIPDGATVEVSYTEPPVTRAGAAVTLHVPSADRPPAPAVHSVVPAFQWESGTSGGARTSTRLDGCVRVYLQRPWHASGEGEMLAVRVLGPNEQPGSGSEKWATMWGRDPIRQPGSAPVIGYPRPADLLGAVDETVLPGHAMGYPVKYDEGRQLWYADLRFQAQNVYQPFVRLRVARLQQHALRTPQDLRLSAGVDAGFVQIPARRQASVSVVDRTATVTVTGPVPPPGQGNITTRMTAGVQHRGVSSIDDPAQWVTVGSSSAAMVTLPQTGVTGPFASWTGTLNLPVAPPARPLRLLVQEVEDIRSGDRGVIQRVSYLDTFTL